MKWEWEVEVHMPQSGTIVQLAWSINSGVLERKGDGMERNNIEERLGR